MKINQITKCKGIEGIAHRGNKFLATHDLIKQCFFRSGQAVQGGFMV